MPKVNLITTGYSTRKLLSHLLRSGSLLFFLLVQLFCTQNTLETSETHNDRGQLERWQHPKNKTVKEGLYQRYSPDGILLEEAHYLADSLEGERKYYTEKGKIESIEHYHQGQIHGKFQSYYESGQIKIEQEFVNGALNGLSTRYYPNGLVQEKVMLKDNVENGPFTEYYENGKIKTEGSYAPDASGDGAEEGELREYDESGELVRIADCKEGRCLTRWKK